MKTKKTEDKIFNRQRKIILGIILILTVVVIIALVLMGILNFKAQSNGKPLNGLALDDFYSEDSCRCLERNRPVCTLSGFEYNSTRKLCVNSAEKKVTYSSQACSEYECSGIDYRYNFNTTKWEAK